MTELTANAKVIKFIEESKVEKFHNLFLGKNLLDRTQKGKKNDKLYFINYKQSAFPKILLRKQKGKSHTGRKYSHYICLTKKLHPKYVKNSYTEKP